MLLNPRNGVILTGATGYVGSHALAALIEAGVPTLVVLREGRGLADLPDFVRPGDKPAGGLQTCTLSADPNALARAFAQFADQCQGQVSVLHLAALYIADHQPDDIAALIDSNVTLTARVAEAASAAGVAGFVNAGTAWEFDPDGRYRPVNLYASTKYAADRVLDYYRLKRNLAVVRVKLYDTFGRRDPRKKLLPHIKAHVLSGERLTLTSPDPQLDIVYIDDVIAALGAALDHVVTAPAMEANAKSGTADDPSVFFVSSGRLVSIGQIIAAAEAALGYALPVAWGAEAARKYGPVQLVRDRTGPPGWHPQVTLEAGLAAYLSGGTD